jgi:uncharacterized protein
MQEQARVFARNRFQADFGDPPDRAIIKLREYLHPWVKDFIRHSPFVVLATSDGQNACTNTPRGGPPGFVHVVDDRTLLLPDVAGNHLFQSSANIDKFSPIGLLFFIPGVHETVRVSGTAEMVTAAEYNERARFDDSPAARLLQTIRISVTLAYGHCGRALKFADLWNTRTIDSNARAAPVIRRPPGV